MTNKKSNTCTSKKTKELIAIRDFLVSCGNDVFHIQREIDVLFDQHRLETQEEREKEDAEHSHHYSQMLADWG